MTLAGRRGLIRAAVIQGEAPLLLSRPALKKLGASMNFAADELVLFDGQQKVAMSINEAGQYTVPVAEFEDATRRGWSCRSTCRESVAVAVGPQDLDDAGQDHCELSADGRTVIRHHVVPRRDRFTPAQCDCPVPVSQLEADRKTQGLCRDGKPFVLKDSWKLGRTSHGVCGTGSWTGTTTFQVCFPARGGRI